MAPTKLKMFSKVILILTVAHSFFLVDGHYGAGSNWHYSGRYSPGGRYGSYHESYGGGHYGKKPWSHGQASSTTAPPTTTSTTSAPATPIETRSFEELRRAAFKEGGKLVVYAGGDAPDQQDGVKAAFEARFPGMTVDIIVDLSKYHGPRIDYQHSTNSVVVDVAHLQTLHDYPRWKKEGILLNYKPLGWEQVFSELKDADGYFVGFTIYSFSNLVNHQMLPNNSTWPREARDFLRPEFKDKIVVSYPNDDDAILFWFKQIVDKYGWEYVHQLKAQNITLVRSTQNPYDYVYGGRKPLSVLTSGGFEPNDRVTYYVPEDDPFISWPQTAAIFKAAPHPAAAKLYVNWLLSEETQKGTWSTRRDIPPPKGWKTVWDYPNTDPTAFAKYMEDRVGIEIFKTQIGLILGEVKGNSPTGNLGTHPVKPIPH